MQMAMGSPRKLVDLRTGRCWLCRKDPHRLEAWRVASLWGKSWFVRQKRNASCLCPAQPWGGASVKDQGDHRRTPLHLSQPGLCCPLHLLVTGLVRVQTGKRAQPSLPSTLGGLCPPGVPGPLHTQSPDFLSSSSPRVDLGTSMVLGAKEPGRERGLISL